MTGPPGVGAEAWVVHEASHCPAGSENPKGVRDRRAALYAKRWDAPRACTSPEITRRASGGRTFFPRCDRYAFVEVPRDDGAATTGPYAFFEYRGATGVRVREGAEILRFAQDDKCHAERTKHARFASRSVRVRRGCLILRVGCCGRCRSGGSALPRCDSPGQGDCRVDEPSLDFSLSRPKPSARRGSALAPPDRFRDPSLGAAACGQSRTVAVAAATRRAGVVARGRFERPEVPPPRSQPTAARDSKGVRPPAPPRCFDVAAIMAEGSFGMTSCAGASTVRDSADFLEGLVKNGNRTEGVTADRRRKSWRSPSCELARAFLQKESGASPGVGVLHVRSAAA